MKNDNNNSRSLEWVDASGDDSPDTNRAVDENGTVFAEGYVFEAVAPHGVYRFTTRRCHPTRLYLDKVPCGAVEFQRGGVGDKVLIGFTAAHAVSHNVWNHRIGDRPDDLRALDLRMQQDYVGGLLGNAMAKVARLKRELAAAEERESALSHNPAAYDLEEFLDKTDGDGRWLGRGTASDIVEEVVTEPRGAVPASTALPDSDTRAALRLARDGVGNTAG